MENLTQNGHNQGLFSKIRALYSIFMGMGSPLFFSIVTLLWVWLKLHKNPWIYLNIPENVWINCFDYARALDMHDHLKYSTGFLRYLIKVPGFWIWHGCIWTGYTEFRIYLIMASYASVLFEYTTICRNIPQYAWTLLNVSECLKMSEWTVLMNIVTVTNVMERRQLGFVTLNGNLAVSGWVV